MLMSNASSDGTVISLERQNAKKAVVHNAHSKRLLWSSFHLLRIPLIFHRMPRVIGRHPALPCELPILPHRFLIPLMTKPRRAILGSSRPRDFLVCLIPAM